MSYSWDKIGKRIKEERKKMPSKLPKTGERKAGYVTQQELAEMICEQMGIEDTGKYRKDVIKWEAGNPVDQKELLILCNIFHCDIHYLLCETDTRYYVDTPDIEKYGLTAEALSTLYEMAHEGHGFELATISAMIQNRQLIESITELWVSEALFQNRTSLDVFVPEGIAAWYQSGEKKQKEFELYRDLMDFIESGGDDEIHRALIEQIFAKDLLFAKPEGE